MSTNLLDHSAAQGKKDAKAENERPSQKKGEHEARPSPTGSMKKRARAARFIPPNYAGGECGGFKAGICNLMTCPICGFRKLAGFLPRSQFAVGDESRLTKSLTAATRLTSASFFG